MRTTTWWSGLCLLAACGGADGQAHGTGPTGNYPWGRQDQNADEARVKASVYATAADGATLLGVELFDAQTFEPVQLKAGDSIEVRSADRHTTLQLEDELLPNTVVYNGQLLGSEPGTHFEFTLHSAQWGDARAEVSLPEPLTMTAPSADEVPDLDEPFDVTWEGGRSADLAEARYVVRCNNQIAEGSRSGDEDERHRELDIDITEPNLPCDLQVFVQRQQFGTMEGSWGGSAVGMQVDGESWHIE